MTHKGVIDKEENENKITATKKTKTGTTTTNQCQQSCFLKLNFTMWLIKFVIVSWSVALLFFAEESR